MLSNNWYKCLTSDIAAQFQTVQDSLAQQFDISISILDYYANAYTIPSNQPLCCFQNQCKVDETVCKSSILSGIKESGRYLVPVNINCPKGLDIIIIPLGENKSAPIAYLTIGKIFISEPEELNNFQKAVSCITKVFELLFILLIRGNLVESIPLTSNQTLNEKGSELLTKREQQVLTMVGTGLSNQAIAKKLFISDSTVKTHITNILAKLHMNNRTELALYTTQVLQKHK